MRSNPLKKKLQNGETVVGSFLYIPSGKMAELIALSGFDFITIDQEHGPIGAEAAEDIIRAAELFNCAPMIRVRHLHQHCILQALDSGALGVHVPNVRTADDAKMAAALCRYAPRGIRGLAGVRAADYGMRQALGEYCAQANDEVLFVAHIEDIEAVRNLDKILAADAIDVYFIGPSDLSNSLGRPGTMDSEIAAIVRDTIGRITGAGKVAGIFANDAQSAKNYVDMGVRYLATHAVRQMAVASASFLSAVRAPMKA